MLLRKWWSCRANGCLTHIYLPLKHFINAFLIILHQTLTLRLVTAFFRLIRWPNLVFIAITQLLFMYCVLQPLLALAGKKPSLNPLHFSLLVISSVLIAAAGYIINDYFDLNIDRINKPDKLIVQKIIKRRSAIAWHLVLSFIGVAIGFYLDFSTHVTLLGFSNLVCVLLLFIYSISLKKKNIIRQYHYFITYCMDCACRNLVRSTFFLF